MFFYSQLFVIINILSDRSCIWVPVFKKYRLSFPTFSRKCNKLFYAATRKKELQAYDYVFSIKSDRFSYFHRLTEEAARIMPWLEFLDTHLDVTIHVGKKKC